MFLLPPCDSPSIRRIRVLLSFPGSRLPAAATSTPQLVVTGLRPCQTPARHYPLVFIWTVLTR